MDGEVAYSPTIQVTCEGFDLGNISIFPNPSDDNIQVRFNASNASTLRVSIIDVLGQVLCLSHKEVFENFNQFELNTQDLAPAVYYLKIEDIDNTMSPKVIKFVKK